MTRILRVNGNHEHSLPPVLLSCLSRLSGSIWVVELFLAEKCRWTWVTLSRGFFESGSLVIGSGVRAPSPSFVLCMYLTCTVHDSSEPRGWGWEGSRCSEASSYCVKMSIRNSVNVKVSSSVLWLFGRFTKIASFQLHDYEWLSITLPPSRAP